MGRQLGSFGLRGFCIWHGSSVNRVRALWVLHMALFSGTNFEDLFASLTWPCTLPPGWFVEWDGPSAGADHPPVE